jgi:NAD(P)H dehydrogenase (quinone)
MKHLMGFDPILAAHELLPVSAAHPASADVVAAQDEIRWADALTVIYPLWWLPMPVKSGDWTAVQALQDTHILRSAGFELLEHLHFDEVAPQLSAEVVDQHLARVRSCARRHFGESATGGRLAS